MLFSIIVVTFNSGEKLEKTVKSCLCQKNVGLEVIIKDGMSTDNSAAFLENCYDERIKFISDTDKGIYDAMNQAIDYASGDYIIFMNSGDTFYSNGVLEQVQNYIMMEKDTVQIVFGDCFVLSRNGIVHLPHVWTDYCCYRYTICHQAMLYSREYLVNHKFDTQFKVSACIIHYIQAYAVDKIALHHIPAIICNYEGGGVSDTANGRAESLSTQYRVLKECFGIKHYIFFLRMLLSGQLIKQKISTIQCLSNIYEKISTYAYGKRKV